MLRQLTAIQTEQFRYFNVGFFKGKKLKSDPAFFYIKSLTFPVTGKNTVLFIMCRDTSKDLALKYSFDILRKMFFRFLGMIAQ